MNDPRVVPLVFIGPSGVGKSTIVRRLVNSGDINMEPTWTTRPPRPGERGTSVEHVFIDRDTFKSHEQNGMFLETIQVFGLPHWYGVPKLNMAAGVTSIVLRAILIDLLKKHHPEHVIYQIYDDKQTVIDRLREREAGGEDNGDRYQEFDKEVALGKQLAHRSFKNTSIDETIAAIRRAIAEDFKLS